MLTEPGRQAGRYRLRIILDATCPSKEGTVTGGTVVASQQRVATGTTGRSLHIVMPEETTGSSQLVNVW